MKRVAIVTANSLDSRSFIWNEVTKHFRAKISSFSENKVTQEEDGLCVISESSGDVVESYNNPYRRRFKNNDAVDLPHFKIILGVGEDPNLYLHFKDFAGTIKQLNVDANTSDGQSTFLFDVEANSNHKIQIGTNVRISYIHANRIMVMEVFKAFDSTQDTDGQDTEGFVDVLIDADINDFNNLPELLRTDVVIPS